MAEPIITFTDDELPAQIFGEHITQYGWLDRRTRLPWSVITAIATAFGDSTIFVATDAATPTVHATGSPAPADWHEPPELPSRRTITSSSRWGYRYDSNLGCAILGVAQGSTWPLAIDPYLATIDEIVADLPAGIATTLLETYDEDSRDLVELDTPWVRTTIQLCRDLTDASLDPIELVRHLPARFTLPKHVRRLGVVKTLERAADEARGLIWGAMRDRWDAQFLAANDLKRQQLAMQLGPPLRAASAELLGYLQTGKPSGGVS